MSLTELGCQPGEILELWNDEGFEWPIEPGASCIQSGADDH
jgi:hypothetical protein